MDSLQIFEAHVLGNSIVSGCSDEPQLNDHVSTDTLLSQDEEILLRIFLKRMSVL
jgi:hypothetical protein